MLVFQVLHIKNRSSVNPHHVKGILRVDTVTYTGVTGDGVKRSEFDLKLDPEGKERVNMLVSYDEYYKKLVDQVKFQLFTVLWPLLIAGM